MVLQSLPVESNLSGHQECFGITNWDRALVVMVDRYSSFPAGKREGFFRIGDIIHPLKTSMHLLIICGEHSSAFTPTKLDFMFE